LHWHYGKEAERLIEAEKSLHAENPIEADIQMTPSHRFNRSEPAYRAGKGMYACIH
jgi:hypothetical protein